MFLGICIYLLPFCGTCLAYDNSCVGSNEVLMSISVLSLHLEYLENEKNETPAWHGHVLIL